MESCPEEVSSQGLLTETEEIDTQLKLICRNLLPIRQRMNKSLAKFRLHQECYSEANPN